MKTTLISLSFVFSILFQLPVFSHGDGTFKLNSQSSKLEWVGEKVTGKHMGTLSFKSGELQMKEGQLTGGSFVTDMNSIAVTDLEGEWKQKLEGHLKAEDFFNSTKFSEAKFEITKVEYTPNEKANCKITGNLTIKGITHEISFPAKVNLVSHTTVSAETEFKIDRTKWDIKYGSGQFFSDLGDKMIYDEFLVKIHLVADIILTK
jgi:polyisoprenoid-binding protein YceI